MGRTPCCNAEGLKKGAWTADEDQKLIAYIQKHVEGGWRLLPQKAGLQRCGKSCRLRWANYLRPDIKRGEFSEQEEQTIIQLHATLGNRWSAIAKHLPRRTDNEIKNYWNTHLKKRLDKIGTDDPVTDHKPFGASLSPSHNDYNNMANPSHMWDSALLESKASLHQPNSSRSTLVSAQLAPLQSLANQSVESRSTEGGGGGSGNGAGDVSTSLVLSSSENPLTRSRSTSTSKLLNKMATTLTTPLHCLDTLKTILSKSTKGGANNGDDIGNGNCNFECSPSTSASNILGNVKEISRTTSASARILNKMVSTGLAPLHGHDTLKDWQGVITKSTEGDVEGIDGGGVSDVSIGDSYNIESPFCTSNFLINSPEVLANGSFESSGFLGTCQGHMAFDSQYILPTEPTKTEDYNFMEGITNFLLGDLNEPTSSGD